MQTINNCVSGFLTFWWVLRISIWWIGVVGHHKHRSKTQSIKSMDGKAPKVVFKFQLSIHCSVFAYFNGITISIFIFCLNLDTCKV